MAVFYGRNGQSRWQNLEMILALDLQATPDPNENTLRVIPVLLPGADLEKAPRFLLFNTFLDLRIPDSHQHLQRLAQVVATNALAQTLPLDVLTPKDNLSNPLSQPELFPDTHKYEVFFHMIRFELGIYYWIRDFYPAVSEDWICLSNKNRDKVPNYNNE